MPFKDQTRCYRTFGGIRWRNLCDILEDRHEADVAACKAAGARIRLRMHPEGYKQAFFHPEDQTKIMRRLRAPHDLTNAQEGTVTIIAISAIMEDADAAERLYEHVKSAISPDRISIADGTKVIAEDEPEAAEMVAAAFASFLVDR